MVTLPLEASPEKLPLKVAGVATAVTLTMLPLSLGATVGVTVTPPAGATVVSG